MSAADSAWVMPGMLGAYDLLFGEQLLIPDRGAGAAWKAERRDLRPAVPLEACAQHPALRLRADILSGVWSSVTDAAAAAAAAWQQQQAIM
jgi:hypothetical protein